MLRELIIEDAKGMLDWMKDASITSGFDKDFSNYTIQDCEDFIFKNKLNYNVKSPKDLNYAVTDETNEYKGTVSLKHINYQYCFAEMAIVIIKSAQGTGLAQISFNDIVKYGFDKLQLKHIYFSCKKDNKVANKFYLKIGANRINFDELIIKNYNNLPGYEYEDISKLYWYIIYK